MGLPEISEEGGLTCGLNWMGHTRLGGKVGMATAKTLRPEWAWLQGSRGQEAELEPCQEEGEEGSPG